VLGIKAAYYGLHDGAPHEVRLASYPEPLAINVQSPRLTLIKPESEGCRSSDILPGDLYPLQPGFNFYTKIALKATPGG
jgi:hypothetical protein